MAKIKTFAVARKSDGTLEANDASVSVTFSEGKGLVIHGLDAFLIRESMLRTIKALNAAGFIMPGKRITIVYSLGTVSSESLIAELLDLPLAVAIMKERNFADFDMSVRYIGRLCPDGRVDDIDGFVVRACRLKWPPNFVSSLTYPDGGIRRSPGHTYLTEIMNDIKRNRTEEVETTESVGVVESVKSSEVHGVCLVYFKVRTRQGVGMNEAGGVSNEQGGGYQTSKGGGVNEAGGILECVASNGQGGIPDIARMRQGDTVEIKGRMNKEGRVFIHKLRIV